MSTYLEQTRQTHIDLEQSVKSIVYEFQNKAKTQRATVYQNHRMNEHLTRIQNSSKQLLELYDEVDVDLDEEEESYRDRELKSMTKNTIQETVASFDERVDQILAYHKKFPNIQISEKVLDDQDLAEISQKIQTTIIEPTVQFTGEEHYGRFVDLNELYLVFINLPLWDNSNDDHDKNHHPITTTISQKMDYLTYLSTLSHFNKIAKEKKNGQYVEYLKRLRDYFVSFYKRTQPLADLDTILKRVEQEFEENWNSGSIPGYEGQHHSRIDDVSGVTATTTTTTPPLNQPQQNADNTQQQATGEKKRKRNRKKHGKKRDAAYYKEIARLESICISFVELLTDVIESTMIQLEKKQVRTWEEIQNDLAREQMLEQELGREKKDIKEEEEDEGNSNPLNLPIGVDGKPIPFWLFKLHNLNQEFKCEICGNYSYWGPRAFEKHFQERRHANGMRSLGIPNSRHFHQITQIADAVALWDKINKQEGDHTWRADEMEEYEDKDGNVYSKKMYLDMKRQRVWNL